MSYDAHGKRRESNWQDAVVPGTQNLYQVFTQETNRGYTGHEMLDDVGLIHMNGRVYDPMLGRFLSADPFVQQPANIQSLNRYSYVLNNPLSYTDPSGYLFGFLNSIFKAIANIFKGIIKVIRNVIRAIKPYIRTIAAIAVSFIIPNPYLAGFAAGMISSGGDLKEGIIGALTAGAFKAIGGHFQKLSGGGVLTAGQKVAKVVAHGIVGGVSSVARGGKFVAGFLSAGVTQAFSRVIDGLDAANTGLSAIRTGAAALVGGFSSVLGGGKFADGALTGAFSRMFNDEHEIENKVKIKFEYESDGLEIFDKAFKDFSVEDLFQDILPEGEYVISVSIDNSLPESSGMRMLNAKTLLVNPAILERRINFIASAIGHELIHLDDFTRGNIDVYDSKNVYRSEVRAYGWQFSTNKHFGLNISEKIWLTNQTSKYRRLMNSE